MFLNLGVSVSSLLKMGVRDFPGGAVVKNPPANGGDMDSIPGREDPTCCGATTPVRHNYWAHVPQLLKPACLQPVLHNKRGHYNEKPVHHNIEYPSLVATRESPRAAAKTQRSQKKPKKQTTMSQLRCGAAKTNKQINKY